MLSPAIRFPAELLLRAQQIRIAFFDVDGVLTDGGIYSVEFPSGDARIAGERIKRFSILDGQGLKLLQKAGITPAIVTGRDSPALRERLSSLGVTHALFGIEDKCAAAESVLSELQIDWTHAAVIGDDWPDLAPMRRAAFCCAPPDAHAEVRAIAHHVTTARAGFGAAREFCDLLMVASGRYEALLSEYLR